jgi:hypothetical protein
LHQSANFHFGPTPIFGAEGIKGKALHAKFGASLNGGTHGLDGTVVTEDTGLALYLGPAAIPIHYNTNVAWETGDIDVRR